MAELTTTGCKGVEPTAVPFFFLATLDGTLNAVAAGGGVVGICAIDGMAGIGKTTP